MAFDIIPCCQQFILEDVKMANTKLIEALNRALSLELAGVIQYLQHSFLVTGPEREVYREFFRKQSEEAHEHATTLGDKIVSLGGVPTVEPAVIRQSTDLAEMLKQDLELEREAMAAYVAAWEACTDAERATQFQLEERMAEEQMHIDELEKLTSERQAKVSSERITLRQVS
jgi:bacterioferritin